MNITTSLYFISAVLWGIYAVRMNTKKKIFYALLPPTKLNNLFCFVFNVCLLPWAIMLAILETFEDENCNIDFF